MMGRHATKKSAEKEGKKKDQQLRTGKRKEYDLNKDGSKQKTPQPHKSRDSDPITKVQHILKIVLPHRLRHCDPAFIGVLCGLFVYILYLFGIVHWLTSWVPLVGDLPLLVAIAGLLRFGTEYFLSMKNLSSAKKAVLVTGCDSGFGLVLCKRLVATGFSVFAACSDLDGEGAKELRGHHSKKIRVIEMDVTSEESVKTAAFHVKRFLDQSATEDHGPFGKRLRLWSVITNAGVGLLAPFEVTPMLEIENLFQVNVFGVVRTVKAFLPFLRRCNGRVIVTSSLAGSIPVPNLIAYSMSKMAVKAFAIGLQRELRPFRIRCITIEPFFYRTRLIVSPEQSLGVKVGAVDDTDQRTIYAAFIEEWEQQKKIIQNQADDMEAPMRAFGHALCSVRPKPCYYVMSSMLRMLIYLAPLFDVSYTDFVIAFNRNPAQTMDDIISLEDDRSSESRKIQLQGNRKVEKDKKTNKSSTKPSAHSKKGSPDCGEATPSADSSGNSPQPAAQKEANVSRRALKKDDEGSPGDKRPSQNATPDKKK